MGTRKFLITLAFALLSPSLGNAVPVVSDNGNVVAWQNAFGNFLVDGPPMEPGSDLSGTTGGVASYSTSASLLRWSATNFSYLTQAGELLSGAADVRIDALVHGNGTDSGNLLGGVFTLRAGSNGLPALGIAPGQILLVGSAIDSAALPSPTSVNFLFELTYENPLFADLGNFVTFWGTFPSVWRANGDPQSFVPWGVDWGPADGAMEYDFFKTVRVPEPGSLALLAIALVGFAITRGGRRLQTAGR